MNESKRWAKGLAIMQEIHRQARERGESAEKAAPVVRGRPRTSERRMVHEALHLAVMGFAKA